MKFSQRNMLHTGMPGMVGTGRCSTRRGADSNTRRTRVWVLCL